MSKGHDPIVDVAIQRVYNAVDDAIEVMNRDLPENTLRDRYGELSAHSHYGVLNYYFVHLRATMRAHEYRRQTLPEEDDDGETS